MGRQRQIGLSKIVASHRERLRGDAIEMADAMRLWLHGDECEVATAAGCEFVTAVGRVIEFVDAHRKGD